MQRTLLPNKQMRHSESTRLDQRRSRAGSSYPARGTGHLPTRIKTGCAKIQPWRNCTQSFPIVRYTAQCGALLHTKTVAASMRVTALIEAALTSTPLWPVGRYTVNCCPNSKRAPPGECSAHARPRSSEVGSLRSLPPKPVVIEHDRCRHPPTSEAGDLLPIQGHGSECRIGTINFRS